MIVETQSIMMLGKQVSGSIGAGLAGSGSGTAAMPIKKRKLERRASLEASRASFEFPRAFAVPKRVNSYSMDQRNSMDSRRPSMDSRRPSIEARPSMELRVSIDRRGSVDVQTRALPPPSTATVTELDDDMEMTPIEEHSDEITEDEPGREVDAGVSMPSATFHPGRILSQLFSQTPADKPSCVKVRSSSRETEGFIVNRRFMDIVSRRNLSQKEELQRLQAENQALRQSNHAISHNYMMLASQHNQGVGMMMHAQPAHPQAYYGQPAYAAQYSQVMRGATMMDSATLPWGQMPQQN